jgi:hypothetical protein
LIAGHIIQERNGAGNRHHTLDIIQLSLGDPLRLSLRIDPRQRLTPDRIDRPRAMNGGQERRHIQAMTFSPDTPHPFGQPQWS